MAPHIHSQLLSLPCSGCQGSDQGLDKQETLRSIGIPFMDKGRLRAFLKASLLNIAGELLNLSRNQ
jgi:hypothetical protein